ncbi:MAG: hypothetical protein ACE5G1_15075, partial [bacterium]
MTREFENLLDFCTQGYEAIERAAKTILVGKTELPNGKDCPGVQAFPEQCRQAIKEVTFEQLTVLVKLFEILECSIDKEKFGLTYIELIRVFKVMAEEKTLFAEAHRDKEYKGWIWSKWINLCLRTNESGASRGIFLDIGINPEQELIEISNKSKSIFDDKTTLALLQVLPNWFLKRYDLSTAFHLLRLERRYRLSRSETHKTKPTLRLTFGILATPILAAILVVILECQFSELNLISEVFEPLLFSIKSIGTAPALREVDGFTTLLVFG